MENTLEFKNICKAFSGVQALKGISFSAKSGEVCALLGENGAGKSTLLKILSGAYSADSGEYLINGSPMEFESPTDAIKAGISVIYQERQLVDGLSVTENVFMEELYHNKAGIVDFKKSNEATQRLIDLFGLPFKPQTTVNRLSVAHQQMVEIMKSYRRNSKIIAFDEPTAPLSTDEIKILFKLIEQLKEEGKIILYVSHRLNELFEITDKIVILKDGKNVETVKTSQANERMLVTKMVGRDIGDTYASLQRNEHIGEVVLEGKNLTSQYVHNVCFKLHKGEVLGFAGLVGAGRSETAELLFGADKLLGGEILLDGKPIRIKNPKNAIKLGIGLCPEDRKKQGLVLDRSIQDNVTIATMNKVSKKGILSRNAEKNAAIAAIEKYRIKTPSRKKIVKELSGGNQQKVILGRWLGADLRILILDEPTKGIDVGAKAEIYKMIMDLARSGIGVILISSELTEIINLCDNVVVLREGVVTGSLGRAELSEINVLNLAMKETVKKTAE